MENKIKIYIRLLDEGGVEVFRPTEAISIEKNKYKILPCDDYDPEDEIWEFLPGTIVEAKLMKSDENKSFLAAVKVAEKSV